MKSIYTFGLVSLFLSLLATLAQAQVNDRVSWRILTPTLSIQPGTTSEVKVEAVVAPKNHLYSFKNYGDEGPFPTTVTVGDGPAIRLGGKPRASKKPIVQQDPMFEIDVEYWEGKVVFTVPVTAAANAKPGSKVDGWVNVSFMTCDDKSCMPNTDVKLAFVAEVSEDTSRASTLDTALPVTALDSTAAIDSASAPDSMAATEDTSAAGGASGDESSLDSPMGSTEDIARAEKEGLMAYLGLAALMGALALLTPCVFPMIPITISFFTKRTQTTRRRSLRDAALYSAGIILTFTAIGFLFALLLGASGINDFATNPWVNLAIALVFVVLALNLFGMFEIQVPTSILNRLNRKAQTGGDGIGGVLLMGLVFSLTSFTCTVPFVGGLMVSATAGKWLWPLMGMAVFATVFAAPFFLLALFPAVLKSLPKSGGWLNSVKVVMGFAELAAAIKFFSNADLVWTWGVLTREVFLAIWIAIALVTTFYLLGRFRLPHDSPVDSIGPMRMMFAVGSLTIAFWLLTGIFGSNLGELDALTPPQFYPDKGNTSPLASVSRSSPGTASGASAASEDAWIVDDYAKALEVARTTGMPIFVDFTGYTCTNCRWMEKHMFTRADVAKLMDRYVLVRLYTDGRDSINKVNRQMQIDRFQTIALPYYVIVSPSDSVIGKFPGMTRKAEQFLSFLESASPTFVKGRVVAPAAL